MSLMSWRRTTVSRKNSFRNTLRVLTLVLMNYELYSGYHSFYAVIKQREQLPFSTLQNGIFRLCVYVYVCEGVKYMHGVGGKKG